MADGSEVKTLKFERTISLTMNAETGERELLKDEKTSKPVIFRDLAEMALLAAYPDEQSLSDEEKTKRYKLFNKIEGPNGASFESLSLEEKGLIKKLCLKRYVTLVAGRLGDIIEAQE